MSKYVIRHIETSKYVARPGSRRSYVKTLEAARVYLTREAAEADKCGNEAIVPICSILG